MSPDREFPQIKRDLVDALEQNNKLTQALIVSTDNKERIYRELILKFEGQLNDHHEVLYGNRKEGNDGLIHDVRSMRESAAKREKYLKWGLAGILTAAGSSMWMAVLAFLKTLH